MDSCIYMSFTIYNKFFKSLFIILLSFTFIALACEDGKDTSSPGSNNKKSEIARLAKVIKEVKDFEKRQKALRAKLDVLEKLKASRGGPLFLLDELYKALPDKVWLTKFNEGKGRAKISGVGAPEEKVALFMMNLESSKHYENLKTYKKSTNKEGEYAYYELYS